MSVGGASSKSGSGGGFRNFLGNVFFGPKNWEEMQVKGLDKDPLDTLIGGGPDGWRPRTVPLPDTKIPQVPLAPLPPAQRTLQAQQAFKKTEEKGEVPAPKPTLLDKRKRELYDSILKIYRGGK
jgi:hypothetical protein